MTTETPLAEFARAHLPADAPLRHSPTGDGYSLRSHCPACVADAQAAGEDDGTAGMFALHLTDGGRGVDVFCEAAYGVEHAARALGFRDALDLEGALLGVDVQSHGEVRSTAPAWSHLRTLGDLAALPAPEPLIFETLDRRTLALLAGRHGTGKSFMALDWAACIATGLPWQGRSARQGRVLYVPGEGVYGLRDRLAAWQEHRGVAIDPNMFHLTAGAPRLSDPADVELLLTMVTGQRYDLVVIDTLARAAVGVDENSAKEMGVVIAAADAVRAALDGGTVLLVHHTGKDGSTVRGSSALEGAVDTAYVTDGDPERGVKVSRTKRKDGPCADVLRLRLEPVGASVVLVGSDPEADQSSDSLREAARLLLRLFGAASGGFTRTEARDALVQAGSSRTTAYARLNDMERVGFLVPGSSATRLKIDARKVAAVGLTAEDTDVARPFDDATHL